MKQYPVLTTHEKQGESSVQLEAVFRAIPDLLLCMDSDGRIFDYKAGNPSGLFLPPTEFLGKRIQDVLPKEIGEKYLHAIKQVLQTDKVVSIDYSLQMPNGEHWFEARLVRVAGDQIDAIVRDVSEHVQATERIQRQVRQLSALQSIDAAITASFDLNVTLSVIVRQVISQLGVDAADVLLLNRHTHMLEFAAGQGFRVSNLQYTPQMVGQGYAGMAALKRRMVNIPNLDNRHTDFHRSPNFLQEGFTSYHAVPLIAKGQVTGVLEIYNRSPLKPGEDWLEFLTILAGQAAIAIDSASLFRDLEQTNTELTIAYDAAIEGWSKALELSGRETAEHTHRVVLLTMELARHMGINDQGLVHVRRGALLHDIGEMGIPEHVLHKPGPLTEEEWKIIRQHPQLAFQLLSPLSYLAPALDIPHFHHEKWDGSGYPDSLKGEQIPFTARIFTVVDVYDALTSPRPYRAAWSHQEALNYVREQASKHFDPATVRVFLQMDSRKI